jgi:hypothetical protein
MTDEEIRKAAWEAWIECRGAPYVYAEACFRAGLEAGRAEALQAWVPLTDEDRTRAFQSLPDMLDGFMKTWGWLHFAKAVEAICREKNSPTKGE